jgi:hypothetical protein
MRRIGSANASIQPSGRLWIGRAEVMRDLSVFIDMTSTAAHEEAGLFL